MSDIYSLESLGIEIKEVQEASAPRSSLISYRAVPEGFYDAVIKRVDIKETTGGWVIANATIQVAHAGNTHQFRHSVFLGQRVDNKWVLDKKTGKAFSKGAEQFLMATGAISANGLLLDSSKMKDILVTVRIGHTFYIKSDDSTNYELMKQYDSPYKVATKFGVDVKSLTLDFMEEKALELSTEDNLFYPSNYAAWFGVNKEAHEHSTGLRFVSKEAADAAFVQAKPKANQPKRSF